MLCSSARARLRPSREMNPLEVLLRIFMMVQRSTLTLSLVGLTVGLEMQLVLGICSVESVKDI